MQSRDDANCVSVEVVRYLNFVQSKLSVHLPESKPLGCILNTLPAYQARVAWVEKYKSEFDLHGPAKAICFLPGLGDDHLDPLTTRVGGKPFWTPNDVWPVDDSSRPLEFLAQFDFRGINLGLNLPGNLLQVFMNSDDQVFDQVHYGASSIRSVFCQWKVPDVSRVEISCDPPYESTFSYYTQAILCDDYKRRDFRTCDPADSVLTIHGTKIGGFSPFFGRNWLDMIEGLENPTFLCSIGSIYVQSIVRAASDWLPSSQGWIPRTEFSVGFLDGGVMVFTCNAHSPDEINWSMYLP